MKRKNQLEKEQFDAFVEQKFLKANLEIFKKENPNYDNDFELFIKSFDMETEFLEAEHRYKMKLRKWGRYDLIEKKTQPIN